MYRRKIAIAVMCLAFFFAMGALMPPTVSAVTTSEYIKRYNSNQAAYNKQEVPIIKAFQANYDGSLAQQIVARAIWYMENGYMVYGHSNYVKDGRVDCSNFVSLVFKDFDMKIPTASRSYDQVGVKVNGVYTKLQPGSSKKYMLVGADNLRPGDIFTYWKTDSKGKKYIGHVSIYVGSIKGKPCVIHTISGRPTAIGITDSFTYWYGEHVWEVRRVLTDSAYASANQPVSPTSQELPHQPVIPASYTLPPQRPVVMP